MNIKDLTKLIISLVVVTATALIGSLATFQSIPNWYAHLNRTVLTPPNWVFGPVWTVLFILMGIALFLVWRAGFDRREVRTGVFLFIVQLILNAFWSIIFFGAHQILMAFFEIIVLLIAILATMYSFSRVSKLAFWLMVPYAIWVSFAMILNFVTYLANRPSGM